MMRRRRAGSSFIEAIIGMAILGIALLGLAQLFLVSIANNTRGGGIGQATFLAQQAIDYVRSPDQRRDRVISFHGARANPRMRRST